MILLTLVAIAVTAASAIGLYYGMRGQWDTQPESPADYRAEIIAQRTADNLAAIERNDVEAVGFFTAPRGYEPADVDALLEQVTTPGASASSVRLGVCAGGYRMDQVDAVIAALKPIDAA